MTNEEKSEKTTSTLQDPVAQLRKTTIAPKEIEEEVRKQLAPLFADFYPSSEKFLIYKKYLPKFVDKNNKSIQSIKQLSRIIATFGKCASATASEDERKQTLRSAVFLSAMTHLLQVELIGNAFVDQTILLLIGGGSDLHLEPDYAHRYVRHATSLEDLESPSLSLSVKLDFLQCNGLTFFSKWIDRKLRNKIAHLDFEIDEKGNFQIGKKRVDLTQKLKTFVQYLGAVQLVFAEEAVKGMNHTTS